MEQIYRILKTAECGNLRWLDFRDWHWVIDECLEKDYLERDKESYLRLTKTGAEFIGLYESMLELLPKSFLLTL